jgi:hypothetical protein
MRGRFRPFLFQLRSYRLIARFDCCYDYGCFLTHRGRVSRNVTVVDLLLVQQTLNHSRISYNRFVRNYWFSD